MDYFLQNKKLSMRIVVGLVLVVVLSLVWTNLIRTPAYSVSVDGEKTFVVKQKSDVEKTLVSIQKQQEKQNQPKLELSSQVEYHRTFASRDDILSGKELEQTIRKTFDFKAQAAAIMVDGKAIACVERNVQAEELLSQLKKENTVVD